MPHTKSLLWVSQKGQQYVRQKGQHFVTINITIFIPQSKLEADKVGCITRVEGKGEANVSSTLTEVLSSCERGAEMTTALT